MHNFLLFILPIICIRVISGSYCFDLDLFSFGILWGCFFAIMHLVASTSSYGFFSFCFFFYYFRVLRDFILLLGLALSITVCSFVKGRLGILFVNILAIWSVCHHMCFGLVLCQLWTICLGPRREVLPSPDCFKQEFSCCKCMDSGAISQLEWNG